MSKTPRTDDAEIMMPDVFEPYGTGTVSIGFARQLERELAESNELLLQARTMLDDAAHGRIELSPFDSSNAEAHASARSAAEGR